MGAVFAVALCVGPAQATAQDMMLSLSTGLQTTYVYRGLPQYASEENSSLQLGLDVTAPLGPGRFWGQAWFASATQQRGANDELGTAQEFNAALGYSIALHPDWELTVAGLEYLRFQSDPRSVRTEVLSRVTWRAFQNEVWLILPYASVYTEVARLIGVYGELGALARLTLGEGFTLSAQLFAGLSQYQEDADTDLMGSTVALTYNVGVFPQLAVTGHISSSLTLENINVAPDFIGRHGFVWSGLVLNYTPFTDGADPQPFRPIALGFQAYR